MQEQRIQDHNFQPRGLESGRAFRHGIFARFIPTGNGAGGAGCRYLGIMLLIHCFGWIFFPVLVRQEDRLHRIYLRVQRLLRRNV